MRVGIDARLVHYQLGGISQYILHLIDALSRLDTETQFRLFQSRKDRSSLCERPNFSRRFVWTPPHHRFEQLALPLEIGDIDLLHSPDFIPPLRRRFKSVVTVHDLAFLRFPGLLTPGSERYYGQITRAARSTEAIIAVSDWTRKDLLEVTGVSEEKVTVIHNAADGRFRRLDDRQAVEDFRREHGLPDDFILWVGTIEPRKNLDALLRAMALLGEREPGRYSLVAVGSKGWLYENTLRLHDDLRLSDRVMFYGPATMDELLMLYNAATLFVFPSLYEGFGLPPLEAIACGLPVISSNAACLPEVFGDGALYIEAKDVEGWAEAIRRLCEDEGKRDEMARRGMERASSFSWLNTAEKTLALYRRVCSQ